MRVTRLADAKPYEATGHFDYCALRLQGANVSNLQSFTVGLSHFLPAGGCDRDASPSEKVYVVTEGEVTVITDGGEVSLRPYDSIYLGPDEAHAIENRTNRPASMIVVATSRPSAA